MNRFLFIGDSHSVTGFGDGLREFLFRELNCEQDFFQYSVTASTLEDWISGSLSRNTVNWARKVPGNLKETSVGIAPLDFTSLSELVTKTQATTS